MAISWISCLYNITLRIVISLLTQHNILFVKCCPELKNSIKTLSLVVGQHILTALLDGTFTIDEFQHQRSALSSLLERAVCKHADRTVNFAGCTLSHLHNS